MFEEINKSDIGVKLHGAIINLASMGLIIRVDGFLDSDNSNVFMQAVLKSIQENEAVRIIIIDLLKVNYISSTGLGALSTILIQLKKANQDLYLSNVGKKIRSVMDTLGFAAFFTIIDSPEDILNDHI